MNSNTDNNKDIKTDNTHIRQAQGMSVQPDTNIGTGDLDIEQRQIETIRW